MGACYGKGRGPKDPDKVPYEPTNGGKKKRQKSSDNVSDEGQPEDIDDKLEPTADDNANKETGDRTAVDQDKDDAIQEEIQVRNHHDNTCVLARVWSCLYFLWTFVTAEETLGAELHTNEGHV